MNITKDYLKEGHSKRPFYSSKSNAGKNFHKTSITIHSTANTRSTAKNERAWLDNPSNTRTASWHYVVDENDIIQAIPINEEAWHAGDGNGNKYSIGIEICESGDRKKALLNAVDLVVWLIKEQKIEYDVKKHFDWTGKNCPRILIDLDCILPPYNWDWFMNKVSEGLKKQEWDWKNDQIQLALDRGLITSEEWHAKKDEKMDVWAVLTIMNNLYDKLKDE